MVILGIDPGIATIGYGLIKKEPRTKESKNDNFRCLEYGTIQTSLKLSSPQRLERIFIDLALLIKKHKPSLLAVESLYFFKNIKTALPVSQAKGVILLAAALEKIPVLEFTPLQVKMTITGYGKAEKKQIQKMISVLLRLKDIPKPDDAADALGVAICGALAVKK